jgi:ubiquinone/menaquinone biosynthesis C-methylase UbiE
MRIFKNRRFPLDEETFADPAATRLYDEHARQFMGSVYRRFAARTSRLHIPGRRVLDIGTGGGRLAIEMAGARPDWLITGTDISAEMLAIARRNASLAGVSGRVDFQQAPAVALPFAAGSFDLVTSSASLHLWKDPLEVFKEIARATSPGGGCLLWDNLRLAWLVPLLEFIGAVMGMNRAQRRLWQRAVRSSYTLAEVKAIVRESALRGARVTLVPAFFMLAIAWRKR